MTAWPEIARQFAESGPAGRLDRTALDFLEALPAGQPVLAACSGGADSVFLVLCLHALLAQTPERLHLLHFNHGLRGPDADADADFVRQLAEELGHPFHLGEPATPLTADEASLRTARYDWMGSLYEKLGAGALVLGQHADDLLESQLMALLSGSGPAGFASPMPVRRFPDGQVRLRPLIGLKRRDILAVLDKLPVPYRTDASNADTTYTRNWLRREILPLLEERFPQDIHAGAARTRQLMEEAVAFLDQAAGDLGLDFSDPLRLDVRELTGSQPAVVRRALMAWWLRHFPSQPFPTRPGDAMVAAIATGATGTIVPAGRLEGRGDRPQVLEFEKDKTLVIRPEQAVPASGWSAGSHWHWPAGPLFLPDGAGLSGKLVDLPATGPFPYTTANPGREAWVAGVGGPLEVRQWAPGDRYQPLGAPGTRKVQDIFTDAKLNSEQKAARPVLLDREGAIVWIPGFPPAEAFRICQNHKSALQLTYNPQ